MCGCKGGSKGSKNYVYGLGMESLSIPPNGGYMAETQTCSDSNFVPITYNGSIGNHVVYSPLKKISSYGMHTNGDIFCVHFDDAAVAPSVFVRIESAPSTPPQDAPPPPPASVEPEPVAPEQEEMQQEALQQAPKAKHAPQQYKKGSK